jgi:predicted MFS family arabinose efflux permease
LAENKVTWRLGVAAVVRLFLFTATRFAYPFAPVLGRGLGVPVTSITSALAVNQVTGMFGLVSGPVCDRLGRRRMMLVGSVMLGGGMLLGGAFPVYGSVLLALLLAGLATTFYHPAVLAYIGEWIPYERRGQAMGLSELAFAGSSLLGIPLVGLLMDQFGWRAPFFLLSGVGLLSAAAVLILFPRDPRPRRGMSTAAGLAWAWRSLRKEPAARYAMTFSFLAGAASLNLFAVFGIWMEDAFGLSIVALGTASFTVGLGELIGEGLTAFVADRLGLKRAIITGAVLLTVIYCLLPWLGLTLPGALLGLFVTFMCFEFTIVTFMSLAIEILPGARATMMSGQMAAGSFGRFIGVTVGGLVWTVGGLTANCVVSAVIAGSAVLVLAWGLRGWRAQPHGI